MTQHKYTTTEIEKIVERYKTRLTSITHWTEFRKENSHLQFPSASTLIKHFGSWNEMKNWVGMELYLPTDKKIEATKIHSKEECINKITHYKDHLVSIRHWDNFRIENPELQLPHSKVISKFFNGTWNNMKNYFGLDHNNGGWQGEIEYKILSKKDKNEYLNKNSELIKIITPHKEYLTTAKVWDEYRAKNKQFILPQSKKVAKAFTTWVVMRQVLGLNATTRVNAKLKILEGVNFSKVGQRIKKIRLEHGLSQLNFGELFGYRKYSVSAWEKGQRLPYDEVIEQIAAFSGESKDYILYGKV